ncbi:MAG TPA: flippase [Bacteroidales bacterium]|nr:flippase [Bacteroidales bacterium]
MTLKQKTIDGLLWSSIDNFTNQAVAFIVGIILARLLTPKEFGLIGIVTVFTAISATLINSGFSQALIRKQECSSKDYSTVFYFNIIVSILIYLILFFTAPLISEFFQEPQLTLIVQIVSIGLIIDSLSIIQFSVLNKRIDFKLQTKISLISSIVSGAVGIVLASSGYGVWSLVVRNLTSQIIHTLLLWVWNKWSPTLEFSIGSFKDLFSFGSKLLVNGIVDTIYNNIYYLIIGKYFSAKELGFYTRADMFKNLPSQNILGIVFRVSYPVLSTIQNDQSLLKSYYKKMVKSTMLFSFTLLFSMAAIAEPMILSLLGNQWQPSVGYLQLLCFVGMLHPLQSLNTNVLLVLGRSDLFLKTEIIKKILAVPTIIIGVIFGIKEMIIGMILISVIGYILYSRLSVRFIQYSIKEQILDIFPSLIVGFSTAIVVLVIDSFLSIGYMAKFIIEGSIAISLIIVLCEIFKLDAYLFVKNELISKISALRKE